MNALRTFFGKAYDKMTDEDVLNTHPMHCVLRPPGWLGGGKIGDWLNEHIGVDNHCWLSANDRGSHLFFMTPAQATQFSVHMVTYKPEPAVVDSGYEYRVLLDGIPLTAYRYTVESPANSPSRQTARRLAEAWMSGYVYHRDEKS